MTFFKTFKWTFIIIIFLISPFANFQSNPKSLDNNVNTNVNSKVENTVNGIPTVFAIDGDAALANVALNSGYGGGGAGTKNNPYIIQNIVLNLMVTTSYYGDINYLNQWFTILAGTGIGIFNTHAYFILRNCYVFNVFLGLNAAITLNNVTNGRIESTFVAGMDDYWYPWAYESGAYTGSLFSSMFGYAIVNSHNCTLDNIVASPFVDGYPTQFFPWTYGVYITGSQYITVSNSRILGFYPISTLNSDHLIIENNIITGPSGYTNIPHVPYVNEYIGISLLQTTYSLVYGNKIVGFSNAGIYLSQSDNNTILENLIAYSVGIGIQEDSSSHNNQYSSINSPVNNTNYVQNNPDPGYYPGGISEYYSGEGFDNIPNGGVNTALSPLDCPYGCWSYPTYIPDGYHSVAVQSNYNDSLGFNHEKVLRFPRSAGVSTNTTITDQLVPNNFPASDTLTGTIEFWLLVIGDNTNGSTTISLLNSDNSVAVQFQVYKQQFYVWDGSGYNQIADLSFKNNQWYRISLNVTEDKSYGGLSSPFSYNFQIYNEENINQPMYTSSNLNFVNKQHLFQLQFSTGGKDATCQEQAYVDAIGYAWTAPVRTEINNLLGTLGIYGNSYQAGDNKQEGLVFDYNVQRYSLTQDVNTNGLANIATSFAYIISKADETPDTTDLSLYHAIDGAQFQYTWNGQTNNGNSWDVTAGYQNCFYQTWKFIVPMPKDGAYQITIYTSNSTEFSGSTTTSVHHSNTIYFSKYFDRGIKILSHYENNEPYPPGTMLNQKNDLNVSETIRGYDWFGNSTNTTAYYSFKINNGLWKGPYEIGTGFGTFTTNFTIDKGNYSNLDTVYYYLSYRQFDNNNNTLGMYYLKNDLSVTPYEDQAQQYAFIKKIAPIAYNLSLGYDVVYQSQVAINVSGTTYNPFMDIMDEKIAINFNNLTSSFSEYNVTSNEYLLDHLLSSDTSNISRLSDPQFLYSQNVTDPFIIPLNWTEPSFLKPSISTIQIPLISFDYIHPGLNLSFIGNSDLVTLTYQGLEHWPNSPSHPYQTMLNFTYTDAGQSIMLLYDSYTGIMTYFEYLNDSVPLQTQKIVFALASTNAYPISLQIDKRDEIISTGTAIIPQHLFSIIYDPPGDHSYGEIMAGTSMTYSVEMSNSQTSTETSCLTSSWVCGVGSFIGLSDSQTNTTVKTYSHGSAITITYSSTLTSSQDTEHANLMDHGGDLYVGSGIVVTYYIKEKVSYIVVNQPDLPNDQVDDIRLFNDTPYIDYGLSFNSQFEVLGAYLDQYGLSSLRQDNIFLNNAISPNNLQYVQEIPTSPLLWTPTTSTDLVLSTSNTTSQSYSINIHSTESEAFSFNSPLTSILSQVGSCVPDAGPAIGAAFSAIQSIPDIGFGNPTDLTFQTVSTSSTTQNRQIIAHLEDDDGTPVGQNDQFNIRIYRDLRYNTFGYIIISANTYTSYPHEANTMDRRPPTVSEIISSQQFVHGTAQFQAAGFDEETNVSYIKIYYSKEPFFGIDAQLLTILNSTDLINPNSIYYNFNWNTTSLEGTYYLFAVTYDNAVPAKNYLLSAPLKVVIDNTPPSLSQVSIAQPYNGVYYLFSKAFDADSGISYVQYWDGDPTNASSTLIGMSYDNSSSYNVVWVVNQNGTDNGIHEIYARAYDKAGNFLDSSPVNVTVNQKPQTVIKTTGVPVSTTAVLMLASVVVLVPSALIAQNYITKKRHSK